MKFTEIDREEIEPGYNLARWESENGVWEVRLDRVMYGSRVHVCLKGQCLFQTEYCAGLLPEWQQALMAVVIKIVEQYPEDVDPNKLEAIWPRWRVRPIFNDLRCWHELCEMAGLELKYEQAMLKYRYGISLKEATIGMEDE